MTVSLTGDDQTTLDVAAVEPDLGRIGPYRLVRQLGRGGMGTVYLGIRDDEVRSRSPDVVTRTQRSRDGRPQRVNSAISRRRCAITPKASRGSRRCARKGPLPAATSTP
jgi:serine/threonine protein kinase